MSTRFIQLHFLTAYGANNLNRDDQSQPKAMIFGSANRLRISSQSIKRAWRLSDFMRDMMAGEEGVRTRMFWYDLGKTLVAEGFAESMVVDHVSPIRIAMEGGSSKAEGETEASGSSAGSEEESSQAEAAPAAKAKGRGGKKKAAPGGVEALKGNLFFFNYAEIGLVNQMVRESLAAGTPLTAKDAAKHLAAAPASADVAMFGRMVAANQALGVEGAVQVAHPFTVNKMAVDDDFFTAVDDLSSEDDSGSGHLGSNSFGSGLYYGYVNIDVPLLVENLGGDTDKARRCVQALVDAVATVAPGGKQNTFAARSNAMFMMVEAGSAQPRAFADVFLTPVKEDPMAKVAADRITEEREWLAQSFPSQATRAVAYDRANRVGSMPELHAFVDEVFAG